MALGIITADQRMATQTGVKLCILGPHGIGKTSLLKTLEPASATLFVDMEGGALAVEGWQGDSVKVRDWRSAVDIACLIGGPNPSRRPDQDYSAEHFGHVVKTFGPREEVLGKYESIFGDSISELTRLCAAWCSGRPEAFTVEKPGKPSVPDKWGFFDLLGDEMIGWLRHLQHCPDKNVILVGGLDKKADEYKRTIWSPQVEGGKLKRELPGIVDSVLSMVEMKLEDGTPYRAFVCQTLNQWGYPAKDRSGRLDLIEEPHLGKLIAKMKGGQRNNSMVTTLPTAPVTDKDIPF